jgi:hypothetical protein
MVEHVEYGNISMVQCLLELGADANANPTFERWSAKIRRPTLRDADEFLRSSDEDESGDGSCDDRGELGYEGEWERCFSGY